VDKDTIAQIGINAAGRFEVRPSTKAFPYIYREAMEIQWDDRTYCLYASPSPRAVVQGAMMNITRDAEPFFEFTLINCFPLCDYCGAEQEFSSDATRYSDEWYLDMALAIQNAGWVIPRQQIAACPVCSAEHQLRHDPEAFSNEL